MPRSTPKHKRTAVSRRNRGNQLQIALKEHVSDYGPPRVVVRHGPEGFALTALSGPVAIDMPFDGAGLPKIREAILVALGQLFDPGIEPRLDTLLNRESSGLPAERDNPLVFLDEGGFALKLLDEGGACLMLFRYGYTLINMSRLELLELYDELGPAGKRMQHEEPRASQTGNNKPGEGLEPRPTGTLVHPQ